MTTVSSADWETASPPPAVAIPLSKADSTPASDVVTALTDAAAPTSSSLRRRLFDQPAGDAETDSSPSAAVSSTTDALEGEDAHGNVSTADTKTHAPPQLGQPLLASTIAAAKLVTADGDMPAPPTSMGGVRRIDPGLHRASDLISVAGLGLALGYAFGRRVPRRAVQLARLILLLQVGMDRRGWPRSDHVLTHAGPLRGGGGARGRGRNGRRFWTTTGFWNGPVARRSAHPTARRCHCPRRSPASSPTSPLARPTASPSRAACLRASPSPFKARGPRAPASALPRTPPPSLHHARCGSCIVYALPPAAPPPAPPQLLACERGGADGGSFFFEERAGGPRAIRVVCMHARSPGRCARWRSGDPSGRCCFVVACIVCIQSFQRRQGTGSAHRRPLQVVAAVLVAAVLVAVVLVAVVLAAAAARIVSRSRRA